MLRIYASVIRWKNGLGDQEIERHGRPGVWIGRRATTFQPIYMGWIGRATGQRGIGCFGELGPVVNARKKRWLLRDTLGISYTTTGIPTLGDWEKRRSVGGWLAHWDLHGLAVGYGESYIDR